MKRKNIENIQTKFRSNRMLKKDDSWFFRTREGDVVGPFRDELEASTQLEVYIRLVDSGLLPAQKALSREPSPKKKVG